MNSLWQNMALWQRLAVGAVVVAVLLGGGLAWSSRAGGRAAGGLSAGGAPQGALCPAEPPSGQAASGDATPETADLARVNEAWTPSDNTELATFALG